MWPSIIELREFYATPRGRMAAARISHTLAPLLGASGQMVAYGYAPPFLSATTVNDITLLMPAAQGVAPWPEPSANLGPNRAVLCEETLWPLPDQSIDTVLLVHALENCADPAALLTEAWRVLKGSGRLILVVANRRGLWSRAEATPFGRGRPFTATQLRRQLHAVQFVPEGWRRSLYTPPFKAAWALATAPVWEMLGARLLPLHGGAIVMQAAKQLYAPVGPVAGTAPSLAQKLLSMPQIMPQPQHRV